MNSEDYVQALGCAYGQSKAMQMVKAGLKAIYLSGWQVAADANLGGQMYPDQSLYPANSVPDVVKPYQQRTSSYRPNSIFRRRYFHALDGSLLWRTLRAGLADRLIPLN